MAVYRDQLANEIQLIDFPRRIISLVPSQTEFLFDLGLAEQIVGVTKFCVHPAMALKTKTVVGGTKKFDLETIERLKPDLIIGNKEENYREGIETLRLRYPVWMSDIYNLEDALKMMTGIGEMCGRQPEAENIAASIRAVFDSVVKKPSLRVLYLIWRNPWMAAGPDTFIHALLQTIGWSNAVSTPRYPQLTRQQLEEMDPDIVLLSSEPYPFKQQHLSELQSILPRSTMMLVDGEMFSWYGSRLLHAPAYFNALGT